MSYTPKVKSKIRTTNRTKLGKLKRSKQIKIGDCIFPFHHKKKVYNTCAEDKFGYYCPTGPRTEKGKTEITSNKLTALEYKLEQLDRSKAKNLSWKFPGLGHYYGENYLRGLVWSVGELGLIYSSYMMLDDFISKSDASDIAYENYHSATEINDINEKRDIYKNAFKDKNTAMYVSVGTFTITFVGWIWNVIDAGNAIPNMSPEGVESNINWGMNQNGQIEVSYRF